MVANVIFANPLITAINRAFFLIIPVNYSYSIDESTEAIDVTEGLVTLNGHINGLHNRVRSFNILEENWNGYGAIPPSTTAISNTLSLLSKVDRKTLLYVHTEDIVPNPHGTISIEYSNDKKDWINIEVGDEEASFFYNIAQRKGGSDENVKISDESLLSAIRNAVNKIAENNEKSRDSTLSRRH